MVYLAKNKPKNFAPARADRLYAPEGLNERGNKPLEDQT